MKKVVFIIFMTSALLPLSQRFFHIFSERELGGAMEKIDKPLFSSKNWFNSSFQTKMDSFWNQDIGLHNTLIRIHNQFVFDVYQRAPGTTTVYGKENQFFEQEYIQAYCGLDLDTIQMSDRINKLAYISDKLREQNKMVLVVVCPGKPTIYPEDIPDRFKVKNLRGNYNYFIQKAARLNIPVLDFTSYFQNNKQNFKYSLFSEVGAHWSDYAATIALDSMIHYLSVIRKMKLAQLRYDGWEITKECRHYDNDIEFFQNLWSPVKKRKELAYPIKLRYESDEQTQKLKGLFIGDSFFWQFYDTGLLENVFENGEFDYYFSTAYPKTPEHNNGKIDLSKVPTLLEDNEVIILFNSECNIKHVGEGFISVAYSALKKGKPTETVIAAKIQEMKNDLKWLNAIKAKAQQSGNTLEQQLREDAIFVLSQ